MKRYHFFVLLFYGLSIVSILAQGNSELLESASASYEAKSYQNATKQYLEVLSSGEHSETLYNNLGSVYYQQNDIPHAVLYFEKGLKLDPFNKSILYNLNLAKEQLDNDIIRVPEFILTKIWKYIYTRMGSNTWFILSLFSFFGSVYAFSLWLLHKTRRTKKKGFLGGVILLSLAIFLLLLSSSQATFQNKTRTAVVIESSIPLKSAPEEANEAIMTLEPGVKLFIIDKIGEYEKVKLENGQLGWILQGSYEAI